MVFIVTKNYVINNFGHFCRCCCSCCSCGGGSCSCGCGGGGGGGSSCWWDVAGAICPNFCDCYIFQDSFA